MHEYSDLICFLKNYFGIDQNVELNLHFVDIETITKANKKYLQNIGPTDVISLPIDFSNYYISKELPKDGEMLGDILLCEQVATEPTDLLITHSFLHLLGWDHMSEKDEKEMFGLQNMLVEKFRENN